MSDIENSTNNQNFLRPSENPDAFRHFAFIVDGEVGHINRIQIAPGLERSIACLSSNPIVVEITGDLRSQVATVGWVYDGTTFLKKEE